VATDAACPQITFGQLLARWVWLEMLVVVCVCVETSGGMAVQLMRMIDTYSLTSARQLAPGQQKTVVGPGIGQFLLRHSTRTHHYLHHSTLFQLRW